MSKHTPGPWQFIPRGNGESGALVRDGSGMIVAEAWACDAGRTQTDNARLIAAAPDLLAALQEIAVGVSSEAAVWLAERAIAKAAQS